MRSSILFAIAFAISTTFVTAQTTAPEVLTNASTSGMDAFAFGVD